MTRPTPPGVPADDAPGDNTAVRTRQLRALLDTASPAEAGDAVGELIRLAASGGGDAALDLAVRYSEASDCSTDELLRLWATADGDPFGFCENLEAPAYRARKAVRRLVALSAPGDGVDMSWDWPRGSSLRTRTRPSSSSVCGGRTVTRTVSPSTCSPRRSVRRAGRN